MNKSELDARYEAAVKQIETKKNLDAGQSYAAGAAILMFKDSAIVHKAAFGAKFLLLVLGIFAAFYMTKQV